MALNNRFALVIVGEEINGLRWGIDRVEGNSVRLMKFDETRLPTGTGEKATFAIFFLKSLLKIAVLVLQEL